MRYMGIDYGKKRVGIAFSDEDKEFALPYTVLANTGSLIEDVISLIKKKDVEKVIVGESRDFKGRQNTIMKDIDDFKKELQEKGKVPVGFEPEFLTSMEARRVQGPSHMTDASAAALILRRFIDRA